jgi:serine protease Do
MTMRAGNQKGPWKAVALALCLAASVRSGAAQDQGAPDQRAVEPSLVRVNIISETRLPGNFEVYGKRIPEYQPKVIQVFPATGIVMDDSGHVLTFLGYRWVDIQSDEPRIDIITSEGQKYRGKLVGIDQSMGVAVVLAPSGTKLKKTSVCRTCEIRDGATVVAPVAAGPGVEFRSSQIVSVAGAPESAGAFQFTLTVNGAPGVGEPILNTNHHVLGFVASQETAGDDRPGARVAFYPISQLMSSAEKIIRAGGHIRTGWLGVYLVAPETRIKGSGGVTVKAVQDGSPAQKAGIVPEDVILNWRGVPLRDARQFIRLVQDTPIGSTAGMNIIRQGRPMTLSALIEARKQEEAVQRLTVQFPEVIPFTAAEAVDTSVLGINAVPLTPQLCEALQIHDQPGLLVVAVEPQNSFARAGVLEGDVIVMADGQRVQDPQSLVNRVRSRNGHIPVILKILRKGSERTVSVLPTTIQ